MCSEPNEINGQKVACRECDQCLAARINTWVARAMAEKAVTNQTFVICLTYADKEDGERPLGSRVFRYKDVQNWLKMVREYYKRQYGENGLIRYIACGERGSKGTKRIHWHVIIFTQKPIDKLGEWRQFSTGQRVEELKMRVKYNWTLWPHGLCHLVEPDAAGMAYNMKYCVKDQFGVEKSKGRKRFDKSDQYAAGMFRMSKKPPIGVPYLERKLKGLRETLSVPPTVNIKIPDYRGYWFLTGEIREWFLDQCRQINEQRKEKTGKDAPQWEALLNSLIKENEEQGEINSDMETLYYGTQERPEYTEEQASNAARKFEFEFAQRQKARNTIRDTRAALENCTGVIPCDYCRLEWSSDQQEELRQEENQWFDRWRDYRSAKGKPVPSDDRQSLAEFRRFWKTLGRPSRGCKAREDGSIFSIVGKYKALRRAARIIKKNGPQTNRRGDRQ